MQQLYIDPSRLGVYTGAAELMSHSCRGQASAGAIRSTVEAHLRRPEAKDILLHGLQALQRELQPNVEQQEHHPQLSDVAHSLDILDDAQGVGPDQRPAGLHGQHVDAQKSLHPGLLKFDLRFTNHQYQTEPGVSQEGNGPPRVECEGTRALFWV